MTALSAAQVAPARSWSTTSSTGAGSATWSGHGRRGLLTVRGQLTWRTSRRLHASFRRVVDAGGRELRVDLRSVTEADPAGVAVLLVHARLLPTLGGTLEVLGASGPCRAVLRRLQLSHLLDEPEPPPDLRTAAPPRLVVVPRPRQDGCSAGPAAAREGSS